jgi:hypothetical protein
MQGFWIILVIAWIVIPLIARKKQREAKERAARERAARMRAAAEAAERQQTAQAPMRTTPLAPRVSASVQLAFIPEGSVSTEGMASHTEGTPKHELDSTLGEKTPSLKQIRVDPEHVVSYSGKSGHRHEETSMTGIHPKCPPDAVTAAHDSAYALDVAMEQAAFVWDPAQVRNGIVMAEILGPCLALRE